MAIPHFPFTGEPFKAQMGLKNLDLKDWIEIDEFREDQLRQKARILRDHRPIVLSVQDEAMAAPMALELHETLWDHLQTTFPSENFAPNDQNPKTAADALADTARWVQEDFCVLSPKDGTLAAGIVCFPSRWKISDKIGKTSDGVHQPVDHFKPIAKPTTGILMQLSKPLVRFNWTIHATDELFTPEPTHHKPEFAPDRVLQGTFLRVERQTLRRLPRTQAVVFSIRTYTHRMDEVLADSERLKLLRSTFETLPREVAEYRGMRYFYDDLKSAIAAL